MKIYLLDIVIITLLILLYSCKDESPTNNNEKYPFYITSISPQYIDSGSVKYHSVKLHYYTTTKNSNSNLSDMSILQ